MSQEKDEKTSSTAESAAHGEKTDPANVEGRVEMSNSSSTFADLAKAITELKEQMKDAKEHKRPEGVRSEEKETIEKINKDVLQLREQLDKELSNMRSGRRGEFDLKDVKEQNALSRDSINTILDIDYTQASEDYKRIQDGNDDLYIAATLLNLRNPMESTRLREYAQKRYPMLYNAMNTGSGNAVGEHWIPTGFSRSLIEKIRLERKVTALHERFDMPTNPYKLPIEGADAVAYRVPERTGNDDDLTANLRVKASTPGTSNMTYTAQKLGVRVVTSAEITEDSIIPILPHIKDKIALALAEQSENTTINGDVRVSASNIDGITTDDSDQRTAWDGYRRQAQLAGSTVDLSGANFTLANIRKLRAKMGKYGVNHSRIVFVTGVNVWNQLLNLDAVTTIDKFGPQATILTGELGRLDGIPIIISEFVPQNADAGGLNAGTSNKSMLLLVRRDAFRYGDVRDITLKTKERIETDQVVLVALQRQDFKCIYGSDAVVANGVGISLI